MKHNLLLWIFLFIACTGKSQVIPVDIVERVTNSAYIFEGEVIRCNSYWKNDSTFIFTSSTIRISKIFKGDISCGTIEVITDGGLIPETGTGLTISHNLVLRAGMKGIFLCNQTARQQSLIDFYPESNFISLDFPYGIESYIRYYYDGVNSDVVDWQFQLDSLAVVYDMVELYTQLNYVNCEKGLMFMNTHTKPEKTKKTTGGHQFPLVNQEKKQPPLKLISPKQSNERSSSAVNNLFYDLMNANVIDSTPRQFEFDIALSDDVDTGYFIQSYCVIDYDTNIFGTDIDSHAQVTVTRAGFTTDTNTYHQPIWFDASFSNHKLVIVFTTDSTANMNTINLPNSPTLAAHVVIKMVSCDLSGEIKLSDPEEYLTSGHVWADSLNCTGCGLLYDSIYWSETMFVPSCHMYVTNLIPTVVHGGVGDLVHISGHFFENQMGHIFLGNADDGDSSFAILDSADILTWTDTLIEFIVPSIVDDNTSITPGPSTPGSGEMVLQSYLGDTSHYNGLIIDYSISNHKLNDSLFVGKYMSRLVGAQTNQAYITHVDSSIANHPDLYGCVQRAMQDWRCLTHIRIDEGSHFSLPASDSTAIYGNGGVIQLGTTPSINAIAATYQWMDESTSCDFPYISEMDIVINKNLFPHFFSDTTLTDKPGGKIDFYANVLHELGHQHSQSHINDPNAIMWWFLDTIFEPALQRKIFLQNDFSAYDAGVYVLNKALDFSGFTCSVQEMNPDTFCTVHPYVNEINKPDIGLLIYPTIVSSKLNVQYDVENSCDTRIIIYDYTGRIVVFEEYKNEIQRKHHEIELQFLPQGFYFVNVELDKYSYSAKFIKQ